VQSATAFRTEPFLMIRAHIHSVARN
jgi:hypothetical protein